MNRLTREPFQRKYDDPLACYKVINNKGSWNFSVQNCINKLGKIEDIMEHFKINSIEQLVNILEAWKEIKDLCSINYFTNIGLSTECYEKITKALEVTNNVKN